MAAQLRDKWGQLSPRQRKIYPAMAVIFLGIFGFSTIVLRGRGTMTVLYSGLDASESREIAAELSRMGIEPKLSEDEASISVPAIRAPEARMRLASMGLPASSPPGDWDIFDRSGLAVTQSQQQALTIRALQGSLARSVSSIDSVMKASVHITLPESSPFMEETKPAKAAVLVTLRPGKTLDRTQAQAIAHLVSHSVPDLDTGGVTILDEKGALLFSDSVAIGSAGANGTDDAESRIRSEVQSLLDNTFGLGKTIVRAAVEIDQDRVETVAVDYEPADAQGRGMLSKESQTVEDARGMGRGRTAGAPGTGANLYGEALPAAAGGVGEYNNTQTEKTYDNPKTETVTVKPPGGIKRISLGIFIDESLQDQQTKIEAVARAAAGLRTDRGDSVSVEAVKFNSTEVAPLMASGRFETIKTIVRWVLNSLAFIIGSLLLRSMIAAVRLGRTAPAPTIYAVPDGRLAMEAANGELQLLPDNSLPPARDASLPIEEPVALLTAEPEPVAAPTDAGPSPAEVLEQLMDQVQSGPIDDIAEVVRHWLEGELDE